MRNKLNPLYIKDQLILILLLVVLGITTQLGSAYILDMILNLMPSVKKSYETLIEPMLVQNELVYVSVILLAPVLEELIFRIGLTKLLKRFLPFWIVNIIQALLFGVYHGNYVQGVYAFILGMMLGYVLNETKLYFSSIVVHMTINASGIVISDIPFFGSPSALVTVIGIASTIISIAILYSFGPKRS